MSVDSDVMMLIPMLLLLLLSHWDLRSVMIFVVWMGMIVVVVADDDAVMLAEVVFDDLRY